MPDLAANPRLSMYNTMRSISAFMNGAAKSHGLWRGRLDSSFMKGKGGK
jgi:hypothetical protein